MGQDTYPPLTIEDDLMADMQGFLAGGGPDRAGAALDFHAFCEGDDAAGHPPLYAAAAYTVGRVDDDGFPPPEVSVFDWGGHFFGVPELRIWYVVQGSGVPHGIGAFPATGAQLPERGEVQRRIRAWLRDRGCHLTVTWP